MREEQKEEQNQATRPKCCFRCYCIKETMEEAGPYINYNKPCNILVALVECLSREIGLCRGAHLFKASGFSPTMLEL